MKFKIGDTVRIINLGPGYPSHSVGAELMNLPNWEYEYSPFGYWEDYIPEEHEHENKATIIGHLTNGDRETMDDGTTSPIYGLRLQNGRSFIISSRGFELAFTPITLEDDLFND